MASRVQNNEIGLTGHYHFKKKALSRKSGQTLPIFVASIIENVIKE